MEYPLDIVGAINKRAMRIAHNGKIKSFDNMILSQILQVEINVKLDFNSKFGFSQYLLFK